jgi:uncharacterized membrane protein (UPF0182 family)
MLYVVDKHDPILKAWESAFPKLFDLGSIPPSIKDHFRYPEDMFTVQTNMWARYHIDDPQAFYSQTAGWSVAQDPGHDVQNPQQAQFQNQQGQTTTIKEARVAPYYAIMQLPGDSQPSMKLFRSFVPFSDDDSKKQLTAFMTAESDDFNDNYGQLVEYQIPSENLPDGPALVGSAISSNRAVASAITFLDQHGSSVEWGNMTLYPIGNSILWVRPLYVAAVGGTTLHSVQEVVVAFGSGSSQQIVIEPTLQQALQTLFPNAPSSTFDYIGVPPGGGPQAAFTGPNLDSGSNNTNGTSTSTSTTNTTAPTTTKVPTNQTVQDLLNKAESLLSSAQQNLQASCAKGVCDLNAYQNAVNQAKAYLAQAQAQETGQATTTTTTSSSTSS